MTLICTFCESSNDDKARRCSVCKRTELLPLCADATVSRIIDPSVAKLTRTCQELEELAGYLQHALNAAKRREAECERRLANVLGGIERVWYWERMRECQDVDRELWDIMKLTSKGEGGTALHDLSEEVLRHHADTLHLLRELASGHPFPDIKTRAAALLAKHPAAPQHRKEIER